MTAADLRWREMVAALLARACAPSKPRPANKGGRPRKLQPDAQGTPA